MLRCFFLVLQVHQANIRAEVAIKAAKRLLCDNMERGGMVDTDVMAVALLQYRGQEANF